PLVTSCSTPPVLSFPTRLSSDLVFSSLSSFCSSLGSSLLSLSAFLSSLSPLQATIKTLHIINRIKSITFFTMSQLLFTIVYNRIFTLTQHYSCFSTSLNTGTRLFIFTYVYRGTTYKGSENMSNHHMQTLLTETPEEGYELAVELAQ